MANDLRWRCVATAHNGDGKPIIASDDSLRELEARATTRLGRILGLPGPATAADDGEVDAIEGAKGPGSLTVDALVVGPMDKGLVSLDVGPPELFAAYIVVQGDLHVAVGSDEAVLHPGDVFIPRGQLYSLRTSASEETRIVRVRGVADPGADVAVATAIRSSSGPARRVRRVVAGAEAAYGPGIVQDGDPAVMFVLGDESDPDVALVDVWELGGLVRSAEQGGDTPDPWELEPRARGMKILNLEMKPADGPAHEGGWHATTTIDVDIVIDGTVEMYLPDLPPVTLQPGDVLLQRGTDHLWRVIGDRSLRMVTVMVGVQAGPSAPATS
jgi:mannose-6-phosphate isomerase-like protein (cupin superfamily)